MVGKPFVIVFSVFDFLDLTVHNVQVIDQQKHCINLFSHNKLSGKSTGDKVGFAPVITCSRLRYIFTLCWRDFHANTETYLV